MKTDDDDFIRKIAKDTKEKYLAYGISPEKSTSAEKFNIPEFSQNLSRNAGKGDKVSNFIFCFDPINWKVTITGDTLKGMVVKKIKPAVYTPVVFAHWEKGDKVIVQVL